MNSTLELKGHLSVQDLDSFVFSREQHPKIQVGENLFPKIKFSFDVIQKLIKEGAPIYGVTTGFGDSSSKYIKSGHAEKLQKNLIQYLSCGQGKCGFSSAGFRARVFALGFESAFRSARAQDGSSGSQPALRCWQSARTD